MEMRSSLACATLAARIHRALPCRSGLVENPPRLPAIRSGLRYADSSTKNRRHECVPNLQPSGPLALIGLAMIKDWHTYCLAKMLYGILLKLDYFMLANYATGRLEGLRERLSPYYSIPPKYDDIRMPDTWS